MQASKRERQATIRQLVAGGAIGSQGELVDALAALGFDVTQATVSRDVAELGLAKVARGDRHLYVIPDDLAARRPGSDDRLRRILGDIPASIGRSGLILVLRTTPGMANAIGQAIDESSLQEQEGTLAGDDTLLVLFADDVRLERWRERFAAIQLDVLAGQAPVPAPLLARIPTEVSR